MEDKIAEREFRAYMRGKSTKQLKELLKNENNHPEMVKLAKEVLFERGKLGQVNK